MGKKLSISNHKGFFMDGIDGASYVKAAAYMAAGIAMGIGALGPAIGQGLIGMKACETIGKYPESTSRVRTTMLIAMGLVETAAIYSFIIAILLVLFVR
jgi:F-type H+-transporting ATPase subunit c